MTSGLRNVAERVGRLKGCLAMLLGAGAIETAKQLLAGPPELALAATFVTPVLNVLGSLLPNLATNDLADAASFEYAKRNHHLRLGMVEALRIALDRTRAELKVDPI